MMDVTEQSRKEETGMLYEARNLEAWSQLGDLATYYGVGSDLWELFIECMLRDSAVLHWVQGRM